MKEAFWGYFLIGLGALVIVVMMLVQNYTSTSEEDYYLTKEVLEASMIDAVDYGLYAQTGEIRIIESKFRENFIRRFAESVNNSKTYTIEFYDIYENPPKASVLVKTKTGNYTVNSESTNFDILTTLSGILESKYGDKVSTKKVDLTIENGSANYSSRYAQVGDKVEFIINGNPGYNNVSSSECITGNAKIRVAGNVATIYDIMEDSKCVVRFSN